MRSLATRQSNLALSKYVSEAVQVLKAAKYDLIILKLRGLVNPIQKYWSIAMFPFM